MHQDEALQTVPLQESRRSLLVLGMRDEHHLRLDGREAQELRQLQAAQGLVFGRYGLLVAVAVGKQGARTFEGSGGAYGDTGQVAQVGRRQRRLLVGGEDYRRVEISLLERFDGGHLPLRILWQLEVDVLVEGVVEDRLVQVRVEATDLASGGTGQERQVRLRERLPDGPERRGREQYVAQIVQPDEEDAPEAFLLHLSE
jgi:hypothetical protein